MNAYLPIPQFMFIAIVILVFGNCNDSGVVLVPNEPKLDLWEEVELFRTSDIRYMKIYNGRLYVSAVNYSSSEILSYLVYTKDGENWDTLKTFSSDIGPFTFNGDTLILVETGLIWEYHASFGWKKKHELLIAAWLTRDIIILNNELFLFENKYISVSNDSISQINTSNTVSKFVKQKIDNKEIGYTIPYYVFTGYPLKFDGKDFIVLDQGISNKEHLFPNYPAITINQDTLYAGFNTPTMIKKYYDGKWENIFDTLVLPHNGSYQETDLNIIISSIHIENNHVFVGTKQNGIYVWVNNEWNSISEGLKQTIAQEKKYFAPIIYVEYFSEYLFTAYGEPGFAPVHNGRGLFKYKYNMTKRQLLK
jgi:hypothetical protein